MIRVVFLVLLLVPAWGFAQEDEQTEETKEPSLAELARRERARRAQLKEVIVITNANLKRVGGGFVSTAAGAAPPAEVVQGEQGAEGEGEAEGEADAAEQGETDDRAWEGEFGEARLNLKNAVNRDLVLQLKMNDLRNEFLSGSGADQSRIQQQMLETQQEIEKNAKDVQSARKAMDDLQSEAKNEGVANDKITDMVGELPDDTTLFKTPGQ